MTFEEFFKKKKIDLVALTIAEPALFDEFKLHYQLMGEKSFDHTKKYLFNPLRLKYHTPEEPKVEKPVIETPASAVATPTAVATDISPAKMGFKPKFKIGITSAPATPGESVPIPTSEQKKPAEAPTASLGFKPKFKAGVTQQLKPETEPELNPPVENPPEAPVPSLGFKPKFRAVAPKPVEETTTTPNETKQTAPTPEALSNVPTKSLGFKPKFKSSVTTPPAGEQDDKQAGAD